ncbi:uncharacterized protein [Paramisgurnus dabryanus]|uniref:uncharacterized protein n=1 Tax=Paramisgurnus dabryanus TaxID=90735 RepID=UPI0031F33A85
MNLTGVTRHLNGTILRDSDDEKAKAVIFEDKLFKIALLSLALCVLAVTGIILCILYHNNRRKSKLAYINTATREVAEEPVVLTRARTTHSLCNKFSRRELKDNSRIYYIFSNPTPVVPEEDMASTHTLKEYDITLNPPTFYMQVSNFL